jgi:hypothetical protein
LACPIPSSCDDSITALPGPFPLNMDAICLHLAAGDEEAQETFALRTRWLCEATSGLCHSWYDLAFLHINQDGPVVPKTSRAPTLRWTPM